VWCQEGQEEGKEVMTSQLILFNNESFVRKLNCAIERAMDTGDEYMIALIHDIMRAKVGHIEWSPYDCDE